MGGEHGKLCGTHGGRAGQIERGVVRRAAYAEAEEALSMYGQEIEIGSAGDAVMQQVREAAGNVAYLRERIQALLGEVDTQDNGLLVDEDGVTQIRPEWLGRGLAVRVKPETWEAAPHVWVQMYDRERDRLVKFCKVAHDMGIEEARLRREIQQGEWLVRTLDGVLRELRLTAEQQEALPEIMRRTIAELEQGGG